MTALLCKSVNIELNFYQIRISYFSPSFNFCATIRITLRDVVCVYSFVTPIFFLVTLVLQRSEL